MRLSIKVDGIEELDKKLRSLADDLRTEVMREALLAAGEPVLEEAKQRAPRRRGQLQHSLAIARSKEDEEAVRVGPTSDGFYGRFLEKGVGQRRTRLGANRGALTSRPWLEPAARASKAAAGRAAAEVIRRRLEDV